MFYIAEVQGCEPWVNILINPDLECAMTFESDNEARVYAKDNCAWEYRIVEF